VIEREAPQPAPEAGAAAEPAPSAVAVAEEDAAFPIADYDELRVSEILPLLPELDLDELAVVRDREVSGKNRSAVIDRIDDLMDELEAEEEVPVAAADAFPIPNYESLTAEAILPLLPDLTDEELDMVTAREEQGQNRAVILDAIDDMFEEVEVEEEELPVPLPPPPPRKAAAKKVTVKKAGVKKAAAKKAGLKKVAGAKKAGLKKVAGAKKAPVKATVKKVTAKKVTAKKVVPVKVTAKKLTAKKVTAKKVTAKKVTAKKVPVTKVTAKKAKKA
ncbi:MAG: hypothetical protein M3N31_09800, partial [Actinomycetota bacterium]|nr:hypothetical protein [Actinomycetota bacterium]